MTQASLQELYEHHRGRVSDKWSLYLSEYDRLFAPYRGMPIRMFEVGVQNGGSLELWAKYFDNAALLVGCDVNADCARLTFDDPRITVVVGDVDDDATRAQILDRSPRFDLIVDDGSHTSRDIVRTFGKYFPILNDGGLFIVEDLHCGYWQDFQGGLFDPTSSISFFKRLVDVINHEHWGIPNERKWILQAFFEVHGIEFEEQALTHIHSIEFINSMCVVRKRAPDENLLGLRFIAGEIEAVVPGHLKLHMTPSGEPDERGNALSAASHLPENELASLRQAIATLSSVRDDGIKALEVEQDRASTAAKLLDTKHKEVALAQHEVRVLRKQLAIAASQAASDRYEITRLRGELQALRDSSTAQLREHERQAEEFRASRSWRVTAPLRRVSRMLRGQVNGEALPTQAEVGKVPATAPIGTNTDYTLWLARHDTMDDALRAQMHACIAAMENPPAISIVMPTYNANPLWLSKAIESIQNQIYPYWELCIADDASPSEEARDVLAKFAKQDSRIKVAYREANGHIAAASNTAIELATGAWIALMDHDDLLPEHALFWVADCIERKPDARLIYSDEDKIDEQGVRSSPYFKSDWNVDLFYSHNMFSHLGVYRADLVRKVDGFRVGTEGSQDWDLVLRCMEHVAPEQIVHIPRVLYHWRMHAASTALSATTKPYAATAGEKAINEHLARTGIDGHVEYIGTGYRAHYALPTPLPLVTLIIPTRDGVELLRQCIDSIFEKTNYSNYEVLIVDNGSEDPEALAYLDTLRQTHKARVMRDDRPFNYSALNNAAVAQANGEIVGLINNDIQVISPDWLSEMVSLAIQPNVGAVGAKLWYPDGTLQHGGVVLGIGGVASHAHKGLPRGSNGYFGRAHLIQSFSAVTAACLVIRKDRYQRVGGLDEVNLTVAYNDVDLCLRLREAGLRNVWTPYAELFHHESATRGGDIAPERQARFATERAYMLARWGDLLNADPAYSPNLTLDADDFSYAWPPRIERFPSCTKQDKVVA